MGCFLKVHGLMSEQEMFGTTIKLLILNELLYLVSRDYKFIDTIKVFLGKVRGIHDLMLIP